MDLTLIPCVQLVRQIAVIDDLFASDNEDDLNNVSVRCFAVMGNIAAHLGRQFDLYGDDYGPILHSALAAIENALQQNYHDVQNLVEVAFIETIFFSNRRLFDWVLARSGPHLRNECFCFLTREKGYRILNAIRDTFGKSPPGTLEEMMQKQSFLERLRASRVLDDEGNIRDAWGNRYRFELRTLPDTKRQIMCIVSPATLSGYHEDVAACA